MTIRVTRSVYTEGAKLRSVWISSTVILVAVLSATTASAQLASDEVPHERTLPISEEVRQELENSRVRAGFLRLQPSFEIRDFGYDNNVYGTAENPVADWHSTVAAGARFIVPMGPKTYIRGEAMPEYTYYRKLNTRRSFGGDYGLSLLGLFNRMTVEAAASSAEGLAVVSSEFERPAMGTRQDATAELEIDVLRRLSIFGRAQGERQRYETTADDAAELSQLDVLERNEALARGGIRYRFTSFLDVSTAFEETRTSFLVEPGRDNRTNAVILGVHYDRPTSFVNLSAGVRRAEADHAIGSDFPRLSTITGSYYASRDLVHFTVDAYGHRGIAYSLTQENPYYLETRNGAGVIIPFGHRVALRAFGEFGTNGYPLPVQFAKRTDDVTTYGGGFALRLYRNLVLTTIASNSRYDSSIITNNRSIFRVTTVVSARGDFLR